jgi:hypothetical protein
MTDAFAKDVVFFLPVDQPNQDWPKIGRMVRRAYSSTASFLLDTINPPPHFTHSLLSTGWATRHIYDMVQSQDPFLRYPNMPWTLDYWLRVTTGNMTTGRRIMTLSTTGLSDNTREFTIQTGGNSSNWTLQLFLFNTANSATSIVSSIHSHLNTWIHVAHYLYNGTQHTWIHGVYSGTATTSGSVRYVSDLTTDPAFYFTDSSTSTNMPINWALSAVRVTRAERYVIGENFTPPVAAEYSYLLNINEDISSISTLTDPELAGVPHPDRPIKLSNTSTQLPMYKESVWPRGDHYISGTVTINGVPARRKVHLYDTRGGQLFDVVWSDATTGEYSFYNLSEREYFVWADDYERNYGPVTNIAQLALLS